jgi:hypothetical protein
MIPSFKNKIKIIFLNFKIMKINLDIVNDVTYKHAKFIKKFFVLWATKNNKI